MAMGFSGGRVSCGGCSPNPKHPNPKIFTLKAKADFGSVLVLLVNYPNCSNYEGNKILVINTPDKPISELDPHFLEKDNILLARFRPTDEGWNDAINYAKTKWRNN